VRSIVSAVAILSTLALSCGSRTDPTFNVVEGVEPPEDWVRISTNGFSIALPPNVAHTASSCPAEGICGTDDSFCTSGFTASDFDVQAMVGCGVPDLSEFLVEVDTERIPARVDGHAGILARFFSDGLVAPFPWGVALYVPRWSTDPDTSLLLVASVPGQSDLDRATIAVLSVMVDSPDAR
jgi:hypothetical protein